VAIVIAIYHVKDTLFFHNS